MDVDPTKAPVWIPWLRTAAYASFAAFAGALGHVLRSMESGQPVTWTRTLVEGLSAGLVGLLVMWICQAAHVGPQWTAVVVGVSGWLGANASIQVLQRIVWKRLGLSVTEVPPDDRAR